MKEVFIYSDERYPDYGFELYTGQKPVYSLGRRYKISDEVYEKMVKIAQEYEELQIFLEHDCKGEL